MAQIQIDYGSISGDTQALLNIELSTYAQTTTAQKTCIPCENYNTIQIKASATSKTYSIYAPDGTLLKSTSSTSYSEDINISQYDYIYYLVNSGTSQMYFKFTS